eukprot:Awhi_evm1s3872
MIRALINKCIAHPELQPVVGITAACMVFSMYAFGHNYGKLGAWTKNRAHPEMNVVNGDQVKFLQYNIPTRG